MSMQMKVTGFGALERKLSKLPDEVARNIAKPALMKGAEPIVQEAKARAPVGSTGEGRASIESAFDRDGWTEFKVRVGPGAKTKSSRREGFYLRFVELGTVARRTDAGAFRGQVRKSPFLRPALDAQRARTVAIVRRELWRGIEKAAR